MNLLQINNLTESEAREYLEHVRWPNGPICPKCGNADTNIYELKSKKARPGLYMCGACRKQFTVTVGTVMHRSHLSCKQWLAAFHLMNSSKKGISALQLQRELGMGSYESAWFQAHRIRAAMEEINLLSGTVEVDETYIGGKSQTGNNKTEVGFATKKAVVIALVSREGQSYAQPIGGAKKTDLHPIILGQVHSESRICTDELYAYRGIGKHFTGGHHTVRHSRKEYARGDIHTNTVEGFFSLLKRGVHGTFHHVSKKHLGRYCHEFSFRWSRRKIDDGQRTVHSISQADGKRLTYEQLVKPGK